MAAYNYSACDGCGKEDELIRYSPSVYLCRVCFDGEIEYADLPSTPKQPTEFQASHAAVRFIADREAEWQIAFYDSRPTYGTLRRSQGEFK